MPDQNFQLSCWGLSSFRGSIIQCYDPSFSSLPLQQRVAFRSIDDVMRVPHKSSRLRCGFRYVTRRCVFAQAAILCGCDLLKVSVTLRLYKKMLKLWMSSNQVLLCILFFRSFNNVLQSLVNIVKRGSGVRIGRPTFPHDVIAKKL